MCVQEEATATMRGDTGRRVRELHASVARDVANMFEGKSSSELAKLRSDIDAKVDRYSKLVELHKGRKQEQQGQRHLFAFLRRVVGCVASRLCIVDMPLFSISACRAPFRCSISHVPACRLSIGWLHGSHQAGWIVNDCTL